MALITTESTSYDNLFAAGSQVAPVVTMSLQIKSGVGEIKRGQLLCSDSEDGSVLIKYASGNGANVVGILCDDVDASSGATAVVYCSGEFNKTSVEAASGSIDAKDIVAATRAGIYIK